MPQEVDLSPGSADARCLLDVVHVRVAEDGGDDPAGVPVEAPAGCRRPSDSAVFHLDLSRARASTTEWIASAMLILSRPTVSIRSRRMSRRWSSSVPSLVFASASTEKTIWPTPQGHPAISFFAIDSLGRGSGWSPHTDKSFFSG